MLSGELDTPPVTGVVGWVGVSLGCKVLGCIYQSTPLCDPRPKNKAMIIPENGVLPYGERSTIPSVPSRSLHSAAQHIDSSAQ